MTSPTQARGKRRTWIVPAAIIVVAAALIFLVIALQTPANSDATSPDRSAANTSEGSPSSPAASEQEQQAEIAAIAERRDPADALALGPEDAPIGLVVFSDYQCPFCAQWNEETLPAMKEYANAGDLRIEWRDTNIFGEASERASLAAYAAGEQGKFWEYHNALMPNGDKLPENKLSEASLIQLADELGLDHKQFVADFSSQATLEAVRMNAQLGRDLGASSTPAFLISGIPVSGAQPTEIFVNVIDELIAKQDGQ